MGRPQQRPDKKGKISGLVVFQVPTNKVLVLKKFNGKYDLPKGHIDPGESYYQAGIRETWEETGLHPTNLEIHPYTYVTLPSKKLLRFYLAFTEEEEVTLTEHEEASWVTLKEALRLFSDNPAFTKVIKTMYILSKA